MEKQILNLNGQTLNAQTFVELITPLQFSLKELYLSKCSLGREFEGRDIILEAISKLNKLEKLDLSDNYMTNYDFELPESIQVVILKGNKLSEIPKNLFGKEKLRHLFLSGNEITEIPHDIESLANLEELYIGGNKLKEVSPSIGQLRKLRVLYLGGNQISNIPNTIGNLSSLQCLFLQDNIIESLPSSMVQLLNLEVLNLHKNNIKILPVEIIGLRQLKQLSVRENPLLTQFVQNISVNVPSLTQLSARAVKRHKVNLEEKSIPYSVQKLLEEAKCCVGCGGTYFGNGGVSQVEFVDLCGSYRVPFLKYICSSSCIKPQESTLGQVQQIARLRKVLLDKYNPSFSAPVQVLEEEIEQNSMDNDLF